MKGFVCFVSGFVLGGAAAGFAAWRLAEEKYKLLADEEIKCIKAVYTYKKPDISSVKPEEKKEEVKEEPKTEKKSYADTIRNLGYTEKVSAVNDVKKMKGYDLITPDDCGTIYDVTYMTYYANNVLENDRTGEVYDSDVSIQEIIGNEALDHFGDYEDDVTYVRDDSAEMDYEIVRSDSLYSYNLKDIIVEDNES